MFLSFMNYFAIQCFPDTYNLVREGPNITPHITNLMVRPKKILGHEGRCVVDTLHLRLHIEGYQENYRRVAYQETFQKTEFLSTCQNRNFLWTKMI